MAEEEEIQADNGDAEADLDALVNESEDSVSDDDGGGLADLVTAGGDDAVGDGGDAGDLDEILDEVSSVPMEVGSEEAVAEGMGVEFLMEMPLTLTFEVGRAKLKIGDLLSLGQGSVLELHRLVGEDLDLFVNGKLIAHGKVVVINEKFGAQLTEVITPEERIKRMGAVASPSM
ncbi:MAG TPA: flagellar motor switch protein FliN [Deltaproteobacteria bacterium]|nr:flagellar motor switch protein FliN [Deltaproteobacteria bacterium]